MKLFRLRRKLIYLLLAIFALPLIAQSETTQEAARLDPIHLHAPIPLPEGIKSPQIEADLKQDEKDGYNLHLKLADFHIGPPDVESNRKKIENDTLEGHAHLFINGVKIGRVYGLHLHIPRKLLRNGINQVTVTLNSHQHETWTLNGQPFLATVFVDPEKTSAVVYRFSSSPIK